MAKKRRKATEQTVRMRLQGYPIVSDDPGYWKWQAHIGGLWFEPMNLMSVGDQAAACNRAERWAKRMKLTAVWED